MMTALPTATHTLAMTQVVLFDAGRFLLTVASVLFLGYALFVMSALLISGLHAWTTRTWRLVHRPRRVAGPVGIHAGASS